MDARQMLAENGGQVPNESHVRACIRKWGELLEGLPTRTQQQRYTLGVTAVLMENQARALRGDLEETTTANVGSFTKYIFPLLRRVFPNLIANEIVSVQPMTAPLGAIFFLDAIYTTSKGSTNAGATFPRDFDRNYTSEYVSGEQPFVPDGTNYGASGNKVGFTLAFNPVRPLDTTNGYSLVIQEIDNTGTVQQTATDNGTGSFTFSPSGGNESGTINYANGSVSGFQFKNIPASTSTVQAFYYYDGEMNIKTPQMGLDIKKATITAQARRLKAAWSAEAAEDMRVFQGADAETEMVSYMAQEIGLEIDREIITDLYNASSSNTASWDRVPPAGIAEIDHIRSILTTIAKVSNTIHKNTLRSPANFLVTGPDVSALLAQLTTHGDMRAGFVSGGDSPYGPMDLPQAFAGNPHGQGGIYKVGTIMNKWVLYEDPFFTSAQMLVGLKGQSYLDCGFVWSPYIPLQVTPTFLDPADQGFRKAIRTRYGKKLTRPEYYGRVSVTNL